MTMNQQILNQTNGGKILGFKIISVAFTILIILAIIISLVLIILVFAPKETTTTTTVVTTSSLTTTTTITTTTTTQQSGKFYLTDLKMIIDNLESLMLNSIFSFRMIQNW